MKKTYSIRLESKVHDAIKKLGDGSITDGIQKLYDSCNNMEYSEMVQLFKSMKDLLIKYRPEPQTTLQEFADTKAPPVVDKIQKLNDIARGKTINNDAGEKATYMSLYNSLTPTRKQQLTEIINATKKGVYWEDGESYTKKDLLEKRGFPQFIGLV